MDRLANASANASAWPSFLRWLRAIGLTALLLLVPEGAIAGKRVALVIGITQYKSVASLANPARDAAKVAQALRSVNFEVTELTEPSKLTRAELLIAIGAFKRAAVEAEAAIIYYAGQGLEIDEEDWLLPSDANAKSPDEIEETAIRSKALADAVSGASLVRLLIWDASRTNPWGRTNARGHRVRRCDYGCDDLTRVVRLFSTQPDQIASDGDSRASNSPFALALADAIRKPRLQIRFLPSAVSQEMRSAGIANPSINMAGIFDVDDWTF